MDRVFSTRLSEGVLGELDRPCKRLGRTKKQVVEEAILMRAAADEKRAGDVWAGTCGGAWQRREQPAQSIRRARRAFERSMARHHGRGRR